ncbi:MAG: DUF1385 domain-containing protein [Fimbriimonas sp.]
MSATHRPNEVTFSLSAPVGALMRPSTSLPPEDSLDRAAAELRRSGNGMIPVVGDERVIGIVTEHSLGIVLANGYAPSEPLTVAMVPAPTIRPYSSAAEALRLFADGKHTTLLVVDDTQRLMGLLSPSDLYPRRRTPPRPAMVGGMATPFGVYLTNGAVGAGASWLGLVLTGALLFALLTGSSIAAYGLAEWLAALQQPLWLVDNIRIFVPYVLFFIAMRLIPLSGTHAAEHQVVHAIERGEELRPEIVRRMPRVHPRCGTNLAAAVGIFTTITFTPWTESGELRAVLGAFVTLFLWKKVGSFMQLFVTTKPANDKQIRSGIKAGQELLDRYATSKVSVPSVPVRILRSGMLHVMAGSLLCFAILSIIIQAIEVIWNVRLPI